jgi:catechol 2,3-dioxygenase-like lactoylglutathione lyase family enzyme
MKFICSLVTVNDINRSRNFYETILNQKVKFDFGQNVTFHGDFAIHEKSHFKTLIDNSEIKTNCNNFELYFEFNDLEQIVERLTAFGVIFIHNIREQPWRQKVVRFYDPDGHIIEIGETLEHLSYRLFKDGLTINEIVAITNMSDAFVKSSIHGYIKI